MNTQSHPCAGRLCGCGRPLKSYPRVCEECQIELWRKARWHSGRLLELRRRKEAEARAEGTRGFNDEQHGQTAFGE